MKQIIIVTGLAIVLEGLSKYVIWDGIKLI